MKRRHSLIVLLAASAATAQTSVVVPAEYANVEGNSRFAYPLSYKQCRWQWLGDSSAIARTSAVLRSFAFRLDGDGSTKSAPAKTLRPTVTLYVTSVTPTTMNTNWASNRGNAMGVQVFSGALNVPARTATFPLPVKDFAVDIPFTRPFVLKSSDGDLLIDWVEGQAYEFVRWNVDAVSAWKTTEALYSRVWNDSACKNLGGDSASLSISRRTGVLGQSLDVKYTMSPGTGRRLDVMLSWLGISNRRLGAISLPLDLTGLGMPSCALATDILVTQATTSSPIQWPLPNDNSLAGVVLYTQGLAANAAAGNFVVTDDAYQVLLRSNTPTPGVAQSVFRARDNSQATGFNSPTAYYAAILKFNGSFQ